MQEAIKSHQIPSNPHISFHIISWFLLMFFSSPACALRMLERSDVAKTNRCYKIGTLACSTLQVATKLEPFGDQVVS